MSTSNIFKAYDIRGIYPEELNEELAFKIGQGAAEFLKAKNIVIGEDARPSSAPLRKALIKGIIERGVNVVFIGQSTTPLFYFSVNKLEQSAGIMVTPSHNPAEYNGFKIVKPGSAPVSVDSGLMKIRDSLDNKWGTVLFGGTVREGNFLDDYIKFLIKKSGFHKNKWPGYKLIIDSGNGMASIVLKPLLEKLGLSYIPLFFDVDGTFPNHSPNISQEGALDYLKGTILAKSADLGIAFDDDADRVAFLGESGRKICSDLILALIFKYEKGFLKKPTVTYDFRFSRPVKNFFKENGFVTRPGHAFIKQNMRENNSDLAGELSGHFFFKEMNFAESSMLAMLKVLGIIAKEKKLLSELVKFLPESFHSDEINFNIVDEKARGKVFRGLKEKYKDAKIDESDGITVEYENWWFNLRPSNTEPVLRLVVEADTEELLKQKLEEVESSVKNAAG